jgi:AcrR family transcriptional regulator
MTTTELPTRGRPRDPSRDAAILEATLDLLAEVGYERVSIDAIASRAGVSKPTIYRRWPGGKPDLAVAAMRVRQAAKAALPDTGSLRGDLLAAVGRLHEQLVENAGLAAGLATQVRADPELARLFRERVVEAERARLRELVHRAAARGEIADEAAVSPLFSDVAPSLIYTRVLVTDEPVDAVFAAQLVDGVLLPMLTTTPGTS